MSKDFKISKTQGLCHKCGEAIGPGEQLVAMARIAAEEIVREDYHPACWDNQAGQKLQDDPDVLGIWHGRTPRPDEKKKLLIDDGLLIEFFKRLAGRDDPGRVNFRYVLALILMRKKLLIYEGSRKNDAGADIWKVRLKGDDKMREVIDPHMDEEKIAAVSASLGEIMEGDFECE